MLRLLSTFLACLACISCRQDLDTDLDTQEGRAPSKEIAFLDDSGSKILTTDVREDCSYVAVSYDVHNDTLQSVAKKDGKCDGPTSHKGALLSIANKGKSDILNVAKGFEARSAVAGDVHCFVGRGAVAVSRPALSRPGEFIVTDIENDAVMGKLCALNEGEYVWAAAADAEGTSIACIVVDVSEQSPDPELSQIEWRVRVFDGRSYTMRFELQGLQYAPNVVAVSPDGKLVITGGGEDSIRLGVASELKVWDARSGERIAILSGHEAAVHFIGFARNGRDIVSYAPFGKEVIVWDSASWKSRLRKKLDDVEWRLAVAETGTKLAWLDSENRVWLWNYEEEALPKVLEVAK